MDFDTKKMIRVQANQMLARGEIVRRFCEKCGDPKAEMHHPDYHFPDQVRWLCKVCHEFTHTLMDRFAER